MDINKEEHMDINKFECNGRLLSYRVKNNIYILTVLVIRGKFRNRYDIKQSYFDKYNAAKQKINEAVQRAENAEADLEKQKKMSADQKQQNIKDNENITRVMNEQAREIKERTRQEVENIKAQTKQQIDKLTARNRQQMDEYEQGIKEKEAELLAKENELNAKRSEIEKVKSEYSRSANEIRREADEKARTSWRRIPCNGYCSLRRSELRWRWSCKEKSNK